MILICFGVDLMRWWYQNNSHSPLITCNKYGLSLRNQTQTCVNPSVSRVQIKINEGFLTQNMIPYGK